MSKSLKITCIQMDMKPLDVDYNYNHAIELIDKASSEKTDVIVFPEMWNTGFCTDADVINYCDHNGECTKTLFSSLAIQLDVNIVAGSIADMRDGKLFNSSYVFDRNGYNISVYDKTHLFTYMNEQKSFEYGNHISVFELDGVKCGVIICYDLRFPELTRTLALQGIEILFIVSQWPDTRIEQLKILAKARAVENQMYVVCCNSVGKTDDTVFGGNSMIINPLGEVISQAGEQEQIFTAEIDLSSVDKIRNLISVFNDRKIDLYKI